MEKTICSAAELSPAACKTGPPVTHRNQEEASSIREREHPAHCEDLVNRVVPRILLVSNDDHLRPMVRAYLEHVGFAVICCADARRAPEIASSTPNLSLLLLDLSSTGPQGLQIAAELEVISAGMPAVIMSESRLKEDEMEIVGHHGWNLLTKPLQLTELLAVIRQVFNRNRLIPDSSVRGKLPAFPARDRQRTSFSACPSPSNPPIWRHAQGDHRRS